MKLLHLTSPEVKYTINNDSTLIIKIGNEIILKISWAEIRSIDMIICEQNNEVFGIAKEIIKKIEDGMEKTNQEIEEKENQVFDPEEKDRLQKFFSSYINEEEIGETFCIEEIEKVLGKEFKFDDFQKTFPEYFFKLIAENKVAVSLKQ